MMWLFCFNYYFFCGNSEGNTQEVIPDKCFKKFGQKSKQGMVLPVTDMTTYCVLEEQGNKQLGFSNSEVENSIFCMLCACSIDPSLWE